MKHLYNYNVLFYLQATSRKKNYQICVRCNFVFILKKIKLPTHIHFLSIAVSYCQKRRSVSEGSYWISVFFLPFHSLYHWFTSLSKSRIRNLLLVVKELACLYKKKCEVRKEIEAHSWELQGIPNARISDVFSPWSLASSPYSHCLISSDTQVTTERGLP